MSNYRWPAVTKDPDDTLPMQLSVWTLCAQFWAANEEYEVGDFAWPNVLVLDGKIVKGAVGLVLECTGAGRSGSKEPRLLGVSANTALAALDGSVQWTPRVGSIQGVTPVSDAMVNSLTPDGLTVSPVLINESTKLLVDYSGGVLGETYEVEFAFTIGSRLRTGRQVVTIAKA